MAVQNALTLAILFLRINAPELRFITAAVFIMTVSVSSNAGYIIFFHFTESLVFVLMGELCSSV
ncbi:hypothetical protein SY86_23045 [Erwinia tracheiphila]|uniref:Uncharacterized protein n=1 Tax=Erwinia tracheiphila TaxID=65700 RepID=A0A0M2KE01_9GAMM|nr:hypothetical protein SY86_23045 [Erwinia tracheiphila]